MGPFAGDSPRENDSTIAFFVSLMLQSGYRARGDVNGVPLADWQRVEKSLPAAWRAYREMFALDGPFEIAPRAAFVLRHPVLQADSYSRIEERNWIAGRRGEAVGQEVLFDRARRLGFEWDEHDSERWAFLSACEQLANRTFALDTSAMPVFRTEDLTTDPWAVNRLLAWCTDGELRLDAAFVRQAMTLIANRHRPADAHRLPHETYACWPDYRREVFDLLFAGYARRVYEAAGYELPAPGRTAATHPLGEPIAIHPPPRMDLPEALS